MPNERSNTDLSTQADGDDRRGFFTKFLAVIIGGIVAVFPFAAGLAVFADPLRRKSKIDDFQRVALLDEVPADGTPREFPILADKVDAWNTFPNQPIGAVFLRLPTPGVKQVEALNVLCPHAGCFVGFSAARKQYLCPCHTSAFAIGGEFVSGPSPRGLDTLDCEVRTVDGRDEVWVKFQNFYTAREEKKAIA